ncbi:MAG: hypothetical protein Q7K57_05200 [Burkholderiaceae bacterium]|nr:hypothetical protein [Burkholderiaceae bacterium]
MNLSEQIQLHPPFIHLPLEDETRLWKAVQTNLGIDHLNAHEARICLQNISEGLKHLALIKNDAEGWADIFAQLCASASTQHFSPQLDPAAAKKHPLLEVLVKQPSTSRTAEQRKKCLAIGSLAVMASIFHLQKLPGAFSKGLMQLFRSSDEGWEELCAIDFLNRKALVDWQPATSLAVVRNFRPMLLNLLNVGVPAVASFRSVTLQSGSLTSATPQDIASPLTEPPVAEPTDAKKQGDNLSPNFEMFELQKQRDCQPDAVDGYRISPQWIRLDPSECKDVLLQLNSHIKLIPADEAGWSSRAHAAARYVSFFCGISLKKCLRLPLTRKGSMFLDIAQGVIRRDQLVIAPRMDRKDRRRVQGRWWRTRLPMEVVIALQELWARNPNAKTLGQLLQGEGLDYITCQRLFNASKNTSHGPEDTRFAMSLRPCLLALDIHPALVARITGDTMTTPASDFYYLSFSEMEIHEATSILCVWMGLAPPATPVRDRLIGSPKALTPEQFKAMVTRLNQRVSTARNEITSRSSLDEFLAFHNLYTTAAALQLIWGVGGRGDRISSLTFERLFASEHYMALADRRVDRYSRQRIVPSTDFLSATRRHYLEHLRSLNEKFKHACGKNSEFVVKAPSSERPHKCAFTIFEKASAGWEPRELKRRDLSELAAELGTSDLNIARHFWFSALVRAKTAQVAIEALLGHHTNGAEAFGFASGISVREICTYLQPILQSIQEELGFEPLAGCGRTADRFLTFPELSARKTLPLLPSVLLKRKLQTQDFLIPEIPHYDQDPPSNCKTLVAHSQLIRLKKQYLTCDAVRRYPAGALLFCLISMMAVLTEEEQKVLFTHALGAGLVAIDQLVVVEADNGIRPVVQRLMNQHATAAADLVKALHKIGQIPWNVGQKELHLLLQYLDPVWTAKTPVDSARLLSRLASHWAAIEIPPGSLFGALHKAPFIPAADLARLHFKRPCLATQSNPILTEQRTNRSQGDFSDVLAIVNHWGNKDLPMGEDLRRRKGCINALSVYLELNHTDEWKSFFVNLLIADLSPNAPYRNLGPSSLPEYAKGYACFFTAARDMGTPELDPETLLGVYLRMGGVRDFRQSCAARWQMLHICAFLNSRGYSVPAGFLEGKGKKTPALPRIPVYTSHQECDAARAIIDQSFVGKGATYAFAGARLELQRTVPLRISEVRFAKPENLDGRNQLLHITSTGHNHLKSLHSRGTGVLNKSLSDELTDLQRRRTAIKVNSEILLFADAHLEKPYAAFDAVSAAIKGTLILQTGRPEFREHDLRAAATTDVAFNVTNVLGCLCKGSLTFTPPLTASQVTAKHSRFAKASRLARHASPLTTLRYYMCSSMLDLGFYCLAADAGLPVSAVYVAAVSGKKPQAIYASSPRARKCNKSDSASRASTVEAAFEAAYQKALSALPSISLGEPPSLGSLLSEPVNNNDRLVQAVLLTALGLSPQAAGDAAEVAVHLVERTAAELERRAAELNVRLAMQDHAMLKGIPDDVLRLLLAFTPKYARWIVRNKPVLRNVSLALLGSLARTSSKLILHSEQQLLELLPILRTIQEVGLQPVFRPGVGVLLGQLPGLGPNLRESSVAVHPANTHLSCFGTVGFLLRNKPTDHENRVLNHPKVLAPPKTKQESPPEKASPRSYGRAGQLAIVGLLLGLTA